MSDAQMISQPPPPTVAAAGIANAPQQALPAFDASYTPERSVAYYEPHTAVTASPHTFVMGNFTISDQSGPMELRAVAKNQDLCNIVVAPGGKKAKEHADGLAQNYTDAVIIHGHDNNGPVIRGKDKVGGYAVVGKGTIVSGNTIHLEISSEKTLWDYALTISVEVKDGEKTKFAFTHKSNVKFEECRVGFYLSEVGDSVTWIGREGITHQEWEAAQPPAEEKEEEEDDGSEEEGDVIGFYEKGAKYYEFTNFYDAPFRYDGKVWPNSETFFQAHKFLNPDLVELVRRAKFPRTSFALSRKYESYVRSDWDQFKETLMLIANIEKFRQHKELVELLLSTRDKEIREMAGNNDFYWGWGFKGEGQNRLGKLLMFLREEFRSGRLSIVDEAPPEMPEECTVTYDDVEQVASSGGGHFEGVFVPFAAQRLALQKKFEGAKKATDDKIAALVKQVELLSKQVAELQKEKETTPAAEGS